MYGGVKAARVAWGLGDIGVGMMAWLNIISILILQKPALLALKDYEGQIRQGEEPVFRSAELGIEGADFWRDRGEGANLANSQRSRIN